MTEWWNGLTQLNRVFYGLATFCSVFFVWQLIAAFAGLTGDHDVDGDVDGDIAIDHDPTYDQFEHGAEADAAETALAFKLLSVRSVTTFCTLFAWGNALYLNRQETMSAALVYSTLWGLAGMFSIALVFYGMRKLSETGTSDLATCIGGTGTVYMDIPEGGAGQIRTTVSGVVSYVKARCAGDAALKSGRMVRVRRQLDHLTVEVEPIDDEQEPAAKPTESKEEEGGGDAS